MTITHASIVPLIGGETIGSANAFGAPPIHFMSYEAFADNDSHVLNYYKEHNLPYYVLDKGMAPPTNERADVVSSVCPCAGLSMMSQGYGDHNPNNEWMGKTAEYILGEYRPKVFWGENAPHFAGKIGKNVRENLKRIGQENGYTMSVYRTKSLLHGSPQVRERSFYFFWQDTKTPLLGYFNRPHTPIEEVLRSVKSNFQMEPINPKRPTDDPYYKFVLEHIHGGRTHKEHSAAIKPESARGMSVYSYIEQQGYDWKQVAEWMTENDYPREAEKSMYKYNKLKAGGNIMRRGVTIPKDRLGAFVGHYPTATTHPDEDRFITYREAMTIMGLPEDFELVNASKKNANHICQNVPVQTATDMANEVKKYLNNELKMIDTDYIMQYNHSQKEEYIERHNTLEEFI